MSMNEKPRCANCGLEIKQEYKEYDLLFCDGLCCQQWEKDHPEEAGA